MTDFSTTKRKALAGGAQRGHLRDLGALLRDLVDTIDGITSPELGFVDGVTAGTVSASKAVVVDANKKIDTLTVTELKSEVTAASTGTNVANAGKTTFSSTGGREYTMDAPEAGNRAVLACTTAGSTADYHKVSLANGTFDGTNHVATFEAANEVLVVEGLSTSLFMVTGNQGSVTLSTS